MKRQDDVTIILEPNDKILVTSHQEGGIDIHNIGWSIQMDKNQAAKLYQEIGFKLGLNGPLPEEEAA